MRNKSNKVWIALLIVAAVALFLYSQGKTEAQYENYTDVTPHRDPVSHGVGTGYFQPLPPSILGSKDHPKDIQEFMERAKKCGKCAEMEAMFVEDAKRCIAYTQCIATDGRCSKPIVNWQKYDKYRGCELCTYFLRGYAAYIEHLYQIADYIADGTLPLKPREINTDCSSCNDIQRNNADYGEQCLAAMQSQVDDADDKIKVELPDYDTLFVCDRCESLHRQWGLYHGTLTEIENYFKYINESRKK